MTATAEAKVPKPKTAHLESLDQIAANFFALDALLEESGGEVTPEIEQWFAEYDLKLREKVDGYVLYIRHLEGEVQSLKVLEREIADKRASKDRRIEWLKEKIKTYMVVTGVDEVKGDIWKFKIQANGGATPIEVLVQPEDLPPLFQHVIVTPDLVKLREGLLGGTVQPTVAKFGPRGEHLRIW